MDMTFVAYAEDHDNRIYECAKATAQRWNAQGYVDSEIEVAALTNFSEEDCDNIYTLAFKLL